MNFKIIMYNHHFATTNLLINIYSEKSYHILHVIDNMRPVRYANRETLEYDIMYWKSYDFST